MVTRVKATATRSKFTTKSTVKGTMPNGDTVSIEQVDTQHTAYGDLREGLEALGFTLPSRTRVLIGCIASFIASFATSYITFSVAAWLSTAALVYSGSAFLGLLILVLGYCIAFYVSFKSGMLVGKFAMDVTRESMASAAASVQLAAKSKVSLVRGWFTRDSVAVAA